MQRDNGIDLALAYLDWLVEHQPPYRAPVDKPVNTDDSTLHQIEDLIRQVLREPKGPPRS
jgi:hypothetical protein